MVDGRWPIDGRRTAAAPARAPPPRAPPPPPPARRAAPSAPPPPPARQAFRQHSLHLRSVRRRSTQLHGRWRTLAGRGHASPRPRGGYQPGYQPTVAIATGSDAPSEVRRVWRISTPRFGRLNGTANLSRGTGAENAARAAPASPRAAPAPASSSRRRLHPRPAPPQPPPAEQKSPRVGPGRGPRPGPR